MGIIIAVAAAGVGTYVLWSIVALISNIRIARTSGLPVVVQPVHFMNLAYLMTSVFNRPIIERLPFGLSRWKYLHFFYMDWALHTQDAQFEKYGDLFFLATPGGNALCVGDAAVSHEVLMRRHDFPKHKIFYCRRSNPAWNLPFSDLAFCSVASSVRRLGCHSMCFA